MVPTRSGSDVGRRVRQSSMEAGLATVLSDAPIQKPAAVAPPAAGAGEWLRTASLLIPLSLALAVVHTFQLESETFETIALLTVVGFAVHALTPMRFRLAAFTAISFVGALAVFGIADAAMMVSVGVVLIAICHLPLSLGLRVLLLLGVGAVLAAARAGVYTIPWSATVWPILGSMFMFRLALYLYALRDPDTRPTVARTLAYFFMLPNLVFPLYPVIDYGTFGRTYYDKPAFQIYERGVQWITRGLVHLLLYRLVYLHLTIQPAEIVDLGGVVQNVLSTFLLYLRISGQFHLIVGMLHLFGFRLPETHRLYFLSSSFNDFWRRINIYWKDFMMKLVYYPSFFRLRRFGARPAMVAATLIVFLATWILHSYQWFWLRGGFPITAQDGVFWGVLGLFVVVNTLRESKRGRKRTLEARRGWDAGRAFRTVGTFTAIAVLWSLWSTAELGEWVWMWLSVRRFDAMDLLLVAGLLGAGLAVAGRSWDAPVTEDGRKRTLMRQPAFQSSAVLIGLLLLGQPQAYERGAPQLAGFVGTLKSDALNDWDANLRRRGYYEDLDNVGLLNTQFLEVKASAPADWRDIRRTEANRQRTDFLRYDLQPNASIVYKGQTFTTNRWGMRGPDVSLQKPEGVTRIAIVGPSFVMGDGVADEDVFDRQLEALLNAAGERRYEVLNFGVGGYSIVQQVAMLENRVLDFQPDVVILTYHLRPALRVIPHLEEVVRSRTPVPYPELERMLREAEVLVDGDGTRLRVPFRPLRSVARSLGVEAAPPRFEREVQLRLLTDRIVDWSLAHAAERIRASGAAPVLIALDIVSMRTDSEPPSLAFAASRGFQVHNLLDVYSGLDPKDLEIAEWDDHPNAEGHRLIAQRLYRELTESREDHFAAATTENDPARAPPGGSTPGETE